MSLFQEMAVCCFRKPDNRVLISDTGTCRHAGTRLCVSVLSKGEGDLMMSVILESSWIEWCL